MAATAQPPTGFPLPRAPSYQSQQLFTTSPPPGSSTPNVMTAIPVTSMGPAITPPTATATAPAEVVYDCTSTSLNGSPNVQAPQFFQSIFPGPVRIRGILWADQLYLSSDARRKTDVRELDDGTLRDRLQQVGTYQYTLHGEGGDDIPDASNETGVLAQELLHAGFAGAVMETPSGLGVNYNHLTTMAVECGKRNYSDLRAMRQVLDATQQTLKRTQAALGVVTGAAALAVLTKLFM
eukprot:TRINITY_DN2497_c0_g1_i1.p1 TRINITY_DN2497_c0_g1~~TRINITY_DN2497_c0_g1_i1.p1  ORF type:complete len:237 (-),score=55.99 TRINITY_DN2497_c0_g1_i1:96-806(-)